MFHSGIADHDVSQHFIDTYTYSHLTHRILLYALLCLIAGGARPRVSTSSTFGDILATLVIFVSAALLSVAVALC